MAPKPLPRLITVIGLILVPGPTLFALRLIYEQTIVTWDHGLQMVGFSLLHSSILGSLGLLTLPLAAVWALVTLALAITRKTLGHWINVALLVLLALSVAGILIPYEQWKLMMIRLNGTHRVTNDWLTFAAATGEATLLDYLLSHGFGINARDDSGRSPLGAAALQGQTDIARMLLSRGARVDIRTYLLEETPLLTAAQMNHPEMVKLLLEHGADPNDRDKEGRTALDWAQKNKNQEMIAILQARLGK